jgi:hypothetical protein
MHDLLPVAFGCLFLYCTHNAGLLILGRSLVPALEAVANLWVRIGVRPDFVTGSLVGWLPLNFLLHWERSCCETPPVVSGFEHAYGYIWATPAGCTSYR